MKVTLLFFSVFLLSAFAACGGGGGGRTERTSPGSSSASANSGVMPAAPSPAAASAQTLPKIVAFGDSLTAGYGLPPRQSYPALLQQKLDADGFRYQVINAGVSGDTTAGGLRRLDWSLEGGGVRFLILELGANDFLRGQPVPAARENLSQMIERAQARGVTVLLAGMLTPTSSGEEYLRQISEAYQSLAKEHEVELIPFFLEGVAGRRELNLEDGAHPNAEGTKLVADTVYRYLKPMLEAAGAEAAGGAR